LRYAGSTLRTKISWRLALSAALGRTTTMRPGRPPTQLGAPVLHATPLLVSFSASVQIACSSLGSSRRSRSCVSFDSDDHAEPLATNIAMPQLTGIVCRCVVTSCRPIVLPDIVPVITQSTLPLLTLATISLKGICTGIAPSADTQSDCVALE
jgi:hypothetical protein